MAQVLRQRPKVTDPNVLVGIGDDAAVYQLGPDLALVQTVDYITPTVDDPYAFGQIAAANALSDIYAMGGKPIFALNIVGFPANTLPLEVLLDILRGGADKAAEAGVSIVGGHSVDDKEPKYGLCVTGFVHPQRVLTNAQAQAGDALILTKPLGLGIITTAIKVQRASPETITEAVRVMSTLNKAAAEAMLEVGAHACTDVTGFGLLGHLHEMAHASGVGARVSLSQVPVLPQVWELVEEGFAPGGTHANRRFVEGWVMWDEALSLEQQLLLCDAQTSGGLLIAVPPGRAEALLAALRRRGTLAAAQIGEMMSGEAGRLWVEP